MSWDENWEALFRKRGYSLYPHGPLISFVARNFYGAPDRSTVRILEIGSGMGANIWFLAREGFATYGIEGSQTGVAFTRERLERESLSAQMQEGDLNPIQHEDAFFDAVIDYGCLVCNAHEASQAILAEVRRVLKPNGLLFSETCGEDTSMGEYATRKNLTYRDLGAGPFEGLGLIRLIDRAGIETLYGEHLTVEQIDCSHNTMDNGAFTMHKWQIVCRKIGA